MRAARIPMLMAGLLAARYAGADVQSLLACRQLPMGQGRADCLERESERLERERSARTTPTPAPPRTPLALQPPPSAQPGREAGSALRVTGVEYVDGRPVVLLADGERWQAREQRRLTMLADGNVVSIERSPAGMVMHFNHSFYGLHVQRLP